MKFHYLCTTVNAHEVTQSTAKLVIMGEIFLLSAIIIAAAVALMSVKVLLLKGGRFSSQHIHDSKAMRERGIHCVIDQDREARQRKPATETKKHP